MIILCSLVLLGAFICSAGVISLIVRIHSLRTHRLSLKERRAKAEQRSIELEREVGLAFNDHGFMLPGYVHFPTKSPNMCKCFIGQNSLPDLYNYKYKCAKNSKICYKDYYHRKNS